MARSASRDAVLHADEMEDNEDLYIVAGRAAAPPPVTVPTIQEQPKPMRHSHPKPPPTPNTGAQPEVPQNMPNPLLPSAPASPPTPAPSPTPHQRQRSWNPAGDVDNTILDDFMLVFSRLNTQGRESWLEEIVESCDNHLLSYLHQLVSPRLKKDPFQVLPNELCFRILEFVDDPRTFVRASQVSRRWREVLSDDQAWKTLCEKHAYRRMSNDSLAPNSPFSAINASTFERDPQATPNGSGESVATVPTEQEASFLKATEHIRNLKRPRPRSTHRSHFKHRYLVESAWRKGGQMTARHITPDQGVVTSLHLTKSYIVVALDNAKIHVFNTKGDHQRTLVGHVMGVWAMVPWGDILVSGGCDRDVRVWNMATGASVHTLRGHTSTVRCLKMSDRATAISGSRDTTLRVWDIPSGTCKKILMGHQASVRCLEVHGDLVVSGSYDTTAKIWSISTGQCLRTLQGHFSQIYAIVFDGVRIATGSLDTSVRIWDPEDGSCKAILQGHTSLVGQLQIRGSTLVTGGSDGSVRVWSLDTYSPIHRLAAHDNSVTSLQFDDSRIVSGGSDGRVKIWNLRSGTLIRELSQPAEAVWRVAFEDERSVVLASRQGRTVMEVWDFAPPKEEEDAGWSAPISREGSAMGVAEDVGMSEDAVMQNNTSSGSSGGAVAAAAAATFNRGNRFKTNEQQPPPDKKSMEVSVAAPVESENGIEGKEGETREASQRYPHDQPPQAASLSSRRSAKSSSDEIEEGEVEEEEGFSEISSIGDTPNVDMTDAYIDDGHHSYEDPNTTITTRTTATTDEKMQL